MASHRSQSLAVFARDLQNALIWSERYFGVAAADRYLLLVRQALVDLFENPLRAGVTTRPELARNVYVYHLRMSRGRVSGQPVKSPRHMIIFRYAGETVEFARLIHDSRDLARHLPKAYRASN